MYVLEEGGGVEQCGATRNVQKVGKVTALSPREEEGESRQGKQKEESHRSRESRSLQKRRRGGVLARSRAADENGGEGVFEVFQRSRMLEECGEFGIWGPFNRNLGEDCFFFCFVFLSSTFSSSSSATSVRLKIQDCAGEILVGSKR